MGFQFVNLDALMVHDALMAHAFQVVDLCQFLVRTCNREDMVHKQLVIKQENLEDACVVTRSTRSTRITRTRNVPSLFGQVCHSFVAEAGP